MLNLISGLLPIGEKLVERLIPDKQAQAKALQQLKKMEQDGSLKRMEAEFADKDSARNNCVLFMWVTMPQLPNVFEVIKAWGFEYKTCGFTWVKKNKIKDSWFMGMGNWTRSNSELCLLSVKGKPKRIDASILSVIDTPIEKYSKKPDVVKDHIVKLCGNLPRIELFARQKTKGWDVWGNEVH